jgi:glutamine---fructose-6-phosphate transaminase (isomerizing)
MCGIVGIVSADNVSSRLVKALLNLEYRGYDSCGLAICSNGCIDVRKDKGHVQVVADKLALTEMNGTTGLGHTRWATTGAVTKENAHPFVSNSGNFALVHNGIITNYRNLKNNLISEGYSFCSETDTEVLVHLIDSEYNECLDIEKAIRQMCRKLEGTYAFALISTHKPDRLYAARKDSPLIVGTGVGENFIGSDYNAILDYTRRVIPVKDGEYVVINRETISIKSVLTGEKITRDIVTLDWDPELAQKGGYPHYMLKEIHEQPGTIDSALSIDRTAIQDVCRLIMDADRVYLTGVGTTFYVAQCAQYYFSSFSGKHLVAISSDEFEYLAELTEKSVVIAFSQSGETYDTVNALKAAAKFNSRTVGIINVMGSRMVEIVDIAIMQNSGPEICVLSTKAAISQIVIALRISLELGLVNTFLKSSRHKHLETFLDNLSNNVRDVIDESKGFLHTLAKKTKHIKNWYFIGRGIYSAIAQESALKMKEVTYHHAEGIPGGFMKHGSIALIEDGFGSVFFLPPKSSGELYKLTITNAEEIKSRNGFIVAFGFEEFEKNDDLFDYQINLKKTDDLSSPVLLLVLGQLFAYYSAVVLKRDVDKPRSLAKCVTVS